MTQVYKVILLSAFLRKFHLSRVIFCCDELEGENDLSPSV